MASATPTTLNPQDCPFVTSPLEFGTCQDPQLRTCKYRNFFHHAVEGIFQSTSDGKYIEVNPTLARMYGYESPEDLLRTVGDIQNQIYVDPTVRQEFKRRIERDGVVTGLEYEVLRKDGLAIWICENARAVRDDQGGVVYYEGTIHEITQRKEAEEVKSRLEKQLRQSQKMEAIGTLAGGIAHDFNNILGAIVGFTEMALDHVVADEQRNAYLSEVLKASYRARDLVRQILAFSRQTEGKHSAVRLGLLVKETLSLLHASLPANVRCRSHQQADHDWVMADPSQLHQVLMNLCTNAGHAMRKAGGELTIRIQTVSPEELKKSPHATAVKGPHLLLEIQDTGEGMTHEVIARLFEPFFTTKPPGEGTGLGLAVVHGIVTAHNGFIAVHSQPGKGTTFGVFLPQTEAPAESVEVKSRQMEKGRGKLLVVDDELALADLVQKRLRKAGYQVTTRLDSLEAAKSFGENATAFDAVITDLRMPGMSGVQLLNVIRKYRQDIPVILCTGEAQALNAEEVQALGFAAMIGKPIDFAALSRLLKTIVKPSISQKRK